MKPEYLIAIFVPLILVLGYFFWVITSSMESKFSRTVHLALSAFFKIVSAIVLFYCFILILRKIILGY